MKAKQEQSDGHKRFIGWLATPTGVGGLLILLALALYWPATGHEFSHFDDLTYYVHNNQVQAGLGWDGLVWAFCTGTASNWHPLTWLSLMMDADLGSGANDAWTPHFTNLLLHALNSGLLFLFWWSATGAKWRSALVTGLFAVHPLNVESVAWVAERKNLLSMFFFLASLLAYVRFVKESKVQSSKSKAPTSEASFFYWSSLLAFALALLSKPMVVTLPFVLLLLDVWPLQRVEAGRYKVTGFFILGSNLKEKLPFFGLSVASCIITYFVQLRTNAVQSADYFPWTGRVENALVSYVRYLGKTVWPTNLAVFYPHPRYWPAVQVGLAALVLVLVSLTAIRLGRKNPCLITGWFWFLGTLVPVIGLVQAGKQAMADRYAYLPIIGVFIMVVWGGYEMLNRMKLPQTGMFSLGGVILIASMIVTRHQLNYWQNDGTLFSHALAVTRNNTQAEVTLGAWLEQAHQPAEAAEHYRAALVIDPNDKIAHYDLANILDDEGQTDSAIKEYHEAIRCNPDSYEAYYNLAWVLERLRHRQEAIEGYQAALRIKPDLQAARQHLLELGVPGN